MSINEDSGGSATGCIQCPEFSPDTELESKVHKLEEHGSSPGYPDMDPGEFEAAVEATDGFVELRDHLGWSTERTARWIGVYDVFDEVFGDE